VGTVRKHTAIRGRRQHLRCPTASPTDTDVIRRAKQGDEDAFAMLYSRYKRRVFSLCLRMVRDMSVAEELMQEAFLQVYRKLGTYRGEAQFSTWLYRVTVNAVLMHVRKKSLPCGSLDDLMRDNENKPSMQFGESDRVLATAADRVRLERAIADLPPGYRLIFLLHDIEGYEHKEIADMLGCTAGNSKSQLHKARMRIRNLLLLPDATLELRGA
jgi:RNA polymerase sigma-70 factor, ECF subfamily